MKFKELDIDAKARALEDYISMYFVNSEKVNVELLLQVLKQNEVDEYSSTGEYQGEGNG